MSLVYNKAPVVQKVDNAIHRKNHYPLHNAIGFSNTYPLGSDLSGGLCYPTFEQLGPGVDLRSNARRSPKKIGVGGEGVKFGDWLRSGCLTLI